MSAPSEDTIVSIPLHAKSTAPDNADGDITTHPQSNRRDVELGEADGGDDEKLVLNTLGEGPVAPKAANEVAEDVVAGLQDQEPGMKGWINLFGVSPARSKIEMIMVRPLTLSSRSS